MTLKPVLWYPVAAFTLWCKATSKFKEILSSKGGIYSKTQQYYSSMFMACKVLCAFATMNFSIVANWPYRLQWCLFETGLGPTYKE